MTTTNLSDQVFEAVPWYLAVLIFEWLAEVSLKDVHADAEVGFVEVVDHIPSDLVYVALF